MFGFWGLGFWGFWVWGLGQFRVEFGGVEGLGGLGVYANQVLQPSDCETDLGLGFGSCGVQGFRVQRVSVPVGKQPLRWRCPWYFWDVLNRGFL